MVCVHIAVLMAVPGLVKFGQSVGSIISNIISQSSDALTHHSVKGVALICHLDC